MKYIFIALISAVFTVTVSGCAYNISGSPAVSHAPLTAAQVNRLNGIMFAYLDIPAAEFSVVPPKARRQAGGYFYRPSAVTKVMPANAPAAKTKAARTKTGTAAIKKTAPAGAKSPGRLKPYEIIVLNDTLYLKIYSRNFIQVNKNYRIGNVFITVKTAKYDKGYEVVSMAVENKGRTKTIMENFKYSNAGNSFELKKYEVIKNLTVAEKYKRGITLWIKF